MVEHKFCKLGVAGSNPTEGLGNKWFKSPFHSHTGKEAPVYFGAIFVAVIPIYYLALAIDNLIKIVKGKQNWQEKLK